MKPTRRSVLIVCSKICNLLSYDSWLLTLAGLLDEEVQELMVYDAGISTVLPKMQSIELRNDAVGWIGLHVHDLHSRTGFSQIRDS